MSKRGLGKGLDALLATSSMAREKQQVASHSQAMSADGELTELTITSLKPGIYQPRKDMSPEALEELAASIHSQGIIQPIVVRPLEFGGFEIIAGERRWRAAKQAGLKQVPCLIKRVDDRAAIAMALIENIQREDLNVIEEAQALERLQEEFKLTHQQVADVIGKSRATVSNLIRLNQLHDEVKRLVESKQLEMGHARALLVLPAEQQIACAEVMVKKHLTVRQAEALVKRWLNNEEKKEPQKLNLDEEVEQQLSIIAQRLKAPMAIQLQANGKGRVVIDFTDQEQLTHLLKQLDTIAQ
ncbi:ParB/RepB/Spo0J family partition protein [Vibrio cincinnatiensis]|jgi:ParB family chromosome partitioning protein|uniref:Probable chromosome-partitioning protein ParB n=1 Tax=Vibrio cincinnatiensis DSM 19608 TaxID=1123491 RepID=A0A1T4R7W5_VIBCI|nr:ParB/RepB/Spo0J family partition protein [Vibrio cincinnatiensis]MCG3722386.1 ParB/RepB/Spo0J family partition protein [Vibrio cincinnatiensis]MCG3733951.1 ParB/RepB/Spo0J family partition protein [Vibrio cincinnatiensis]MCG3735973.1 ParB/RepB/Spo0J family partition protein [Vibrio cincinnatiensis]MCG3741134.1 ParB/RepB/Spo0J family partition protein [Vibrio cincinnatiensis]MCG3746405.1 ParB/RepB/Spo0J family partition protein [Vibrio cincinnatiensis]